MSNRLTCAGGHGIAWDGSYNKELQRIVEYMYANNKPVAAVDHGPCALVHARIREEGHPDQGKSILYERQARSSTPEASCLAPAGQHSTPVRMCLQAACASISLICSPHFPTIPAHGTICRMLGVRMHTGTCR